MLNWQEFIRSEQAKPYYSNLIDLINKDREKHIIYPDKDDIFNAFKLCSLDKVKIVLFGQDPYINGEAHGLSFSIKKDMKVAPSLKNIFKEINNDLGIQNSSGDLTPWAKQGVLLLNSALTVRAGQSNSHANYGWHTFTDEAIKLVNQQDRPIVYLLWGSFARSKKKFITNPKHLVLESAHPSPLSAHNGFFGNKHFSRCNAFLKNNNIEEINWST